MCIPVQHSMIIFTLHNYACFANVWISIVKTFSIETWHASDSTGEVQVTYIIDYDRMCHYVLV